MNFELEVMKKIFSIVVVVILIAACTPQTGEELGIPFYAGQEVILAATMPSDGANHIPSMKRVSGKDAGTKIHLTWNTGDQVNVTVNGKSAIFTLVGEGGSAQGEFKGTMPADGARYTVTYPANYNENVLANQTYVENGFGNGLMKMMGEGTLDNGFALSAANAILGLQIKGDITLGKIKVTNFQDNSKNYTLNCAGVDLTASAKLFYIVLPAKRWKHGFTAEVYDAEDNLIKSFTNPTDLTFSATGALMMQEIVVNQPTAQPEDSYELRILTFEDDDAQFSHYTLDYVDWWSGREITTWSDLIDDPEYGGPLLYGDVGMGMAEPYWWYDEGNTELRHTFPLAPDGYAYGEYIYCFWSGGHAISNYASTDYITNGGFENQLTVHGTGGHSGENFAVHYGYMDGSSYNKTENLPSIEFGDGVARVVDHMWMNISTYTLNCLLNGNDLTEKVAENGWVRLVATGWDENDNMTGSSIFTFCEGGTNNVIKDWTKWDLSVLGEVVSIQFTVCGDNDNKYGFSQPAYLIYDDVAVRFPK